MSINLSIKGVSEELARAACAYVHSATIVHCRAN